MAQVTLFIYLIISNDYFTINSFTEKDAILVIFFANIVIYKWTTISTYSNQPFSFPP